MRLKNIKFFFIFVTVIILSSNFVFASETNGTVDSTYKYAWSENTGWINFGVSGGNIVITDASMTGYSWSDNYGWINLNPSGSGVVNNGNGMLSGQAWGENTGWINFSGVTIDSSGYFSGYASSTVTGQINFNCSNTSSCNDSDFKIRTDWRPQSARAACNNSLDDDGDGLIDYPSDPGCSSASDTDETDPGGGGRTYRRKIFDTPSVPTGGFKVAINGNASISNSRIVSLSFDVGSNVKKIAISNVRDFKNASQKLYTPTRQWDLCSKFGGLVIFPTCPEKRHTVYVKFYTRFGQSSKIISSSIVYKKSAKGITSNLPSTHFVFTKNIRLGNTGEYVKKLQQFLNQNGFRLAASGLGSPGNETEYFGSLTKKALTAWQLKYSSEVLFPVGLKKGTGFFGPASRAFMNSIFSKQSPIEMPAENTSIQKTEALTQPISAVFTRTLRFGIQNDDVKKLQQLLNSDLDTRLSNQGLGSPGSETIYFGSLTRDAVERFQKKNNIVSSGNERTTGYGLVGPKTRIKFNEVFGRE